MPTFIVTLGSDRQEEEVEADGYTPGDAKSPEFVTFWNRASAGKKNNIMSYRSKDVMQIRRKD